MFINIIMKASSQVKKNYGGYDYGQLNEQIDQGQWIMKYIFQTVMLRAHYADSHYSFTTSRKVT